MTQTAWFHCFAGTAGDMTLGALVHAGADPDRVAEMVALVDVDGYALTFERVQRCGIASTHALVVVHDDHDQHDDHGHEHDHDGGHDHDHGDGHGHGHRPYRVIRELLAASALPERVRDRAQRTFRLLAEVEGEMHGIDPDDVELHEVGSVDAIVDVVGTCAALEVLGIDRIVCGTISVGQGTVNAAHGELPNPAPAVLGLLARRSAPTIGIADRRELATPTGVALMMALADGLGPMPAMRVDAVGYGAGTREVEGRPNVVQVVIGEVDDPPVAPDPGQEVRLIEANVDDATGEVVAHAIATLLARGAHDAWATSIVMKKGRPAYTVHALCDPAHAAVVSATLVDETGSLGLRATTVRRWPQHRDEHVVVVDGHRIRVKVTGTRVKVEHDDAVIAAAALGTSLRVVLERAAQLARA